MVMLTRVEIDRLGFASVGDNVQISDKVSIYGSSRITIGSNVRIDDFCVLSAGVGGICIGQYVHIATYSSLIGSGRITLSDFSGLSSRVSIYSSNDDYSGDSLTNPTVPSEFTGVKHADVFINEHVIVGSGSIILPGTRLEKGVAVGALSVVSRDCAEFGIYAGNPAKRVKERSRNLLTLAERFLQSKVR